MSHHLLAQRNASMLRRRAFVRTAAPLVTATAPAPPQEQQLAEVSRHAPAKMFSLSGMFSSTDTRENLQNTLGRS